MTLSNGREQPAIAYLNELEVIWHDTDTHTLSLAASLPSSPPGPRPDPTPTAEAAKAVASPAQAGEQLRDRATAALLSNLLAWAY